MWKLVFGLVFFLLVLVQVTFLFPEYGDRQRPYVQRDLPKTERLETSEQVLFGGHLIETRGEKKTWELWSEKATKALGSGAWHLQVVKVHFYGEGKKTYTATGTDGLVSADQKVLEILGDVHVVTNSGYRLKTEKIIYDSERQQIFGPHDVAMVGPKQPGERGPLELNADQFRGDISVEKFFLHGHVKGRKPMSDGRVMKIRSQKARVHGKQNHVFFEKSVQIQVAPLWARSPFARFLFVNDQLDSLLMDHGVRMKNERKKGWSRTAKIYFEQDRAVFWGNPRVIEDEDEIIGDRITLLEGGDRVQVVGLKSKYLQKQKKNPSASQ